MKLLSLLAILLLNFSISAESAVADYDKILKSSKSYQDLLKTLDSMQKKDQEEIQKEDQILQDENTNLINTQSSGSKEEIEQKMQALQKKATLLRERVQTLKNQFETFKEKELKNIQEQISKIIGKLSKEKKYDAVFKSESIVLNNTFQDITSSVIKILNESPAP